MSRVLVTGSTGLLGCALVPHLAARGHVVLRHGHAQPADVNADLADAASTATMLEQTRPEVVVNLAALTDVDRCETAPDDAYRLNGRAVENLAAGIEQLGLDTHLIQISTDQLYDGAGPHAEDGVVVRNTYALSKLAAELAALRVPSTVLRTNFFGRSRRRGRPSFTDWLHNALTQQMPITVFDDVLFGPLEIETLCGYIELAVRAQPRGVFNLGSNDGLSKADFAFAFAQLLGLPAGNMTRGRAAQMKSLKAVRPRDMRMNCGRFEQRMGLRLPRLIDQLALMREAYGAAR